MSDFVKLLFMEITFLTFKPKECSFKCIPLLHFQVFFQLSIKPSRDSAAYREAFPGRTEELFRRGQSVQPG